MRDLSRPTQILAALLFLAPCITRSQEPAATQVAETPAPVMVEVTTTDQAIRRRIGAIFSVVEEYRTIEVAVKSGVVTLSGEVADVKVKEEAFSLVKRTEGVVLAVDRLTIPEEPEDVSSQLSPTIQRAKEQWRKLIVKLPLAGVALLVVIVFWVLAELINRRHSWFARLPLSSLGRELFQRVFRLALIAFGVVVALEILDATAIVSAVLGAAGLAGIAIGFAFKNITENYLAGILLSSRNPFEIGDVIDIGGDRGKVARLTSRDTVLVTLDGNHLRIPNSVVMNSRLLNFSRNPMRRFEFTIAAAIEADLTQVKTAILSHLKVNPGVLSDPEPSVMIEGLSSGGVDLKIYGWVDQTAHDFAKTRSESIRLVKEVFDHAGFHKSDASYTVNLASAAAEDVVSRRDHMQASQEQVKPRQEATLIPSAVDETDISTDHSIDEQIEAESQSSNERNLLGDGSKEGAGEENKG